MKISNVEPKTVQILKIDGNVARNAAAIANLLAYYGLTVGVYLKKDYQKAAKMLTERYSDYISSNPAIPTNIQIFDFTDIDNISAIGEIENVCRTHNTAAIVLV